MAYYVDFVGLNTFIYEPVGWDVNEQNPSTDGSYGRERISAGGTYGVLQNTFGVYDQDAKVFAKLRRYKNNNFSHNLPTTASFFPALMLKRNGPYGYNSFKQIRISDNPLTRKQIQNNVFTFVTEPGPEIVVNNKGRLNTIRGRYGAIQKFTENPVYSHSKPFLVGAGTFDDTGSLQRFEVVGAYGSETNFFNNEEVNKYYNKRLQKSRQYSTISGFYLNGGLDKDGSPIDSFEYLKYRECVYPPKIYAYKNYVRQRTTFSFPWRDDRANRTEPVSDKGFGVAVTQSMWPLDVKTDWATEPVSTSNRFVNEYGFNTALGSPHKDYGMLQNSYNLARSTLPSSLGFSGLSYPLRLAPIYSRKHMLIVSSSVVSPGGMNIEGINTGTTMGNMGTDSLDGIGVPGGEAKWEAGSQSSLNPFYDTYDNYIQGVRQYGKDYSIIPEFRISEHVETYQSKGLTEEITSLFSLTGALSNTADSSKTNFYKIYSNSEFMKHFEVIKKDHSGFVPPNSITLKCKAVKKFLPYEGFYPVQRSVDLAKQFFNSYKNSIAVSGALDSYATSSASPSLFQNLMVPTFAPGIFFNTIKAGVACDYPIITSSVSIDNNLVNLDSGDYYLINPIASGDPSTIFNKRIPFEAILEPEKHLAGFELFCNEPHLYANNSGSVLWDGTGDENGLYKLMAQNFLAETNEFFMKSKNFTTIMSKPSNDPTVGHAEAGKTYTMRIKMYKSTDSAIIPQRSTANLPNFVPPQYTTGSRETFTMYSRPTAFGPPQMIRNSAPYNLDHISKHGFNYPFTPPYYHGQAFCDVTFTATTTKKYSIQEIIENSTVRQWRHVEIETMFGTTLDAISRTKFVNGPYNGTVENEKNTMHLDSSVNIFGQTTSGEAGSDPNDPPSRWVIQTKFETPMLNFNHLSASTSITLPQNASQSVPRGMWHQYGNIESDSSKGVFLQVDNIPTNWTDGWLQKDSSLTGSLVDLCGFSTEAAKLGQIADEKKIMEAVVAVPFVERDGERKFFRLSKRDVQRALSADPNESRLTGASIQDMLVKMQKYVFPPSMDFIKNDTIDPFAMYIFEFSHVLKKQDLANIWQNLYPEIGRTFETAESSISHELLAHELLGGGAVMTPEERLDVNAVGNELPDRVQWMVFKVKQRAETNYYSKIIGRQVERRSGGGAGGNNMQTTSFNVANLAQTNQATVTSEGLNTDVSYNWPYDFFSLVELAKIESEVKFAERLIKPGQEPVSTTVPKTRENPPFAIDNITQAVRLKAGDLSNQKFEVASAQQGISVTPTTSVGGSSAIVQAVRGLFSSDEEEERTTRTITTTSGGGN